MSDPVGAWFPVTHSEESYGVTPRPPARRMKKSLKRRAKKKRICDCALRGQCRFICGSMQCPQRRKIKRKRW